MKLQYRYVECIGFKYDIRLYHNGELVRSYIVYIDELNDEIDRLEKKGYTYGYTTKEVEKTKERYEYMLNNIIGGGIV